MPDILMSRCSLGTISEYKCHIIKARLARNEYVLWRTRSAVLKFETEIHQEGAHLT